MSSPTCRSLAGRPHGRRLLLDAQIAQLDEIETLQTEITHLRHENERLQRAGKESLDELARISELLGRRAT
jgi:cell division protein FtsB